MHGTTGNRVGVTLFFSTENQLDTTLKVHNSKTNKDREYCRHASERQSYYAQNDTLQLFVRQFSRF